MKRVITYGTYDLLHYGHINLLTRAKALGDYLIVAYRQMNSTGAASRKNAIFPTKNANRCSKHSGRLIWSFRKSAGNRKSLMSNFIKQISLLWAMIGKANLTSSKITAKWSTCRELRKFPPPPSNRISTKRHKHHGTGNFH